MACRTEGLCASLPAKPFQYDEFFAAAVHAAVLLSQRVRLQVARYDAIRLMHSQVIGVGRPSGCVRVRMQ